MLEKYKRLVRKYIRKHFAEDNVFTRLLTVLANADIKHDKKPRKNGLSIQYTNRKNAARTADTGIDLDSDERHGKLVRQKARKKGTLGSKGKNVWAQLEPFFASISDDVQSAFDSLLEPQNFPEPMHDGQFLNVYAINRLCAIAKMLLYCQENEVGIPQFMEDRTYQKIKARQKQRAGEESIYFPTAEEVDYLLCVGKERANQVMAELKEIILRGKTRDEEMTKLVGVIEGEINTVVEKKANVMEKMELRIKERQQEFAKTEDYKELQEKYLKLSPGIRKRKKRHRTNGKKGMKKSKEEDISAPLSSPGAASLAQTENGSLLKETQSPSGAREQPVKREKDFNILRTIIPFPSQVKKNQHSL